MNAKNTTTASIAATAILGAAIAAGSLAFAPNNTSVSVPSAHDSFQSVASSVSDHDSARFSASTGTGDVNGEVHFSADELNTPSNPAGTVNVADAPSAPSTDSTEERGRRINLVSPDFSINLDGALPTSECTETSIMDISVRDGLDCGLDVADQAKATAADATNAVKNTAKNTVNQVTDYVTDTADYAIDTADAAIEQVTDTVSDTYQSAKNTVSAVAAQVNDRTDCARDLAGNVLDTSVRDIADCA